MKPSVKLAVLTLRQISLIDETEVTIRMILGDGETEEIQSPGFENIESCSVLSINIIQIRFSCKVHKKHTRSVFTHCSLIQRCSLE
jgi:glycerol-3-phosphate responsive antiterminator